MNQSQRGFTSMNLLPVLFCGIVAFLAIGHYVTQQITIGRISRAKYAALLAAESGVDNAVQMITANNGFNGENVNLPATNLLPFASYSTTVTRPTSTVWRVLSTGTYRDGTRSRVVAVIRNVRRNPGSAAIQANGNVNIAGNVEVTTDSGSTANADVLANGNITIGGSALINGIVGAVGTAFLNSGQAVSVHNGIDPLYFPPKSTVDSWKTQWTSQAQAGGTVAGGVSASSIINGNRYIDGDINLGGSSVLELRGPGTVVVKGNVSLSASARIVSSVELVVLGTFTMTGQAVYRVNWSGTGTTPGLWVYGNEPSIASTITTTLLGGSSLDSQGIVTILYGSVRLTGSSAFRGAISVNQGSAEVNTTGTYNQTFVPGMTSSRLNPNRFAVTEITEL